MRVRTHCRKKTAIVDIVTLNVQCVNRGFVGDFMSSGVAVQVSAAWLGIVKHILNQKQLNLLGGIRNTTHSISTITPVVVVWVIYVFKDFSAIPSVPPPFFFLSCNGGGPGRESWRVG